MTLDTPGPLTYLLATVDSIPNVVRTYKGVPESIVAGNVAYIALVGQNVNQRTTSTVRRHARYMVTFAFRIAGAEANAEDKLAVNIDALILAYFADRTLGGTCQSSEIDLSIADAPDYRALAGQEYRMFPILITAVQDQNVGP